MAAQFGVSGPEGTTRGSKDLETTWNNYTNIFGGSSRWISEPSTVKFNVMVSRYLFRYVCPYTRCEWILCDEFFFWKLIPTNFHLSFLNWAVSLIESESLTFPCAVSELKRRHCSISLVFVWSETSWSASFERCSGLRSTLDQSIPFWLFLPIIWQSIKYKCNTRRYHSRCNLIQV